MRNIRRDVIRWELFLRSYCVNFFLGSTGSFILEWDRWGLKYLYGTPSNIKFGSNPILITPSSIVNTPNLFVWVYSRSNSPVHLHWCQTMRHPTIKGALSIAWFGLGDRWPNPIVLAVWTVRTVLTWLFPKSAPYFLVFIRLSAV